MSERLIAGLLALYPNAFRQEFGAECAQLVRDRLREERGWMARLRLCLDLVYDCVAGVPRLFVVGGPAPARAAHGQAVASMFWTEEEHAPRPASLVCAVVLSMIAFGALMAWFSEVRLQREALLWHQAQMQSAMQKSQTRDRDKADVRAFAYAAYDFRPPVGSQAELRRASLTPGRQPDAAPTSNGQPHVEDATAAMVEAIRTHSIVLFGETHANKQEYAWLCSLVKDAAFHARVDDIVVEFGNSLYQKSVDSYIAGKDVPFAQVEKAWRNVVGAVGPVSPVYAEFYKAVRESNMQHRGHQVRLVLGDPYADWEKIEDAEDLGPFVAHRDEWYAQVVKDEVLAKNHRALLIMGAGHFRRANGPGLIEQSLRTAGADPYLVVFGTNAIGGYDDLDSRFDAWTTPAIVSLAGNWVGDLPAMPVLTGGTAPPSALKMATAADAMLYVGSRDSLTAVNVPTAELENTDYGREINRRLMIQMGRTMTFTQPAEMPQFQRPVPRPATASAASGPPMPPMPKSMHDPLPPRPPSQ